MRVRVRVLQREDRNQITKNSLKTVRTNSHKSQGIKNRTEQNKSSSNRERKISQGNKSKQNKGEKSQGEKSQEKSKQIERETAVEQIEHKVYEETNRSKSQNTLRENRNSHKGETTPNP
ncbi:hypothetical protein A2U01_0038369 [Trifolium medium]|uniref:Uncharacterized protein n=1 Tax=Trifolium medium TaxID=97028 RepID=A0A392PZY9_9FABA|nr:hypothetical protein [Trifolium medium]